MSNDFKDFGLEDRVRRPLDEAGYTKATPIQAEALPILLGGQDLIGVAETGTGKTLAFLLPIFQRLEPDQKDPQALVVCPTRELAQQVGAEAERFGRDLGVRTVVAYGGTSSGEQKRLLAAGCELVVGTPGRLLDFVNSAWLSMRSVRASSWGVPLVGHEAFLITTSCTCAISPSRATSKAPRCSMRSPTPIATAHSQCR